MLNQAWQLALSCTIGHPGGIPFPAQWRGRRRWRFRPIEAGIRAGPLDWTGRE
jgi:hypothetical protein